MTDSITVGTLSELHAITGLAATGLLAALAIVFLVGAAWRPATWMGVTWLAITAFVVAQGLTGLVLLVMSARPTEWIHIVYGVFVALVLLVAPFVTATLKPDVRVRLLVVAAAIALMFAWRLTQTG